MPPLLASGFPYLYVSTPGLKPWATICRLAMRRGSQIPLASLTRPISICPSPPIRITHQSLIAGAISRLTQRDAFHIAPFSHALAERVLHMPQRGILHTPQALFILAPACSSSCLPHTESGSPDTLPLKISGASAISPTDAPTHHEALT